MTLPHKLSDNRAKHIMSVAALCYKIAHENGFVEADCKKAFVVGYLHDIGYAFSSCNAEHPTIGGELLELCGVSKDVIDAVRYHGVPNVPQNRFLQILNQADMQVNGAGEVVSVTERLEDIGTRYGFESTEYLTSCTIVNQCGLVSLKDKELEAICHE